jgi:hypothetical protein
MYGAGISLLRDREGLLAVLLAVCLISSLVLAAIGRKSDEEEEEELTTFSQPVESANSRCGHFPYPSKQ